jgi:hypothetical protein
LRAGIRQVDFDVLRFRNLIPTGKKSCLQFKIAIIRLQA